MHTMSLCMCMFLLSKQVCGRSSRDNLSRVMIKRLGSDYCGFGIVLIVYCVNNVDCSR